jgi:Zn-dependent membrane protease YugP
MTAMLLNIDYLLFAIPGIALSLWAQSRISSAYAAASRIPASSGLTGAQAAYEVMRAGGVSGVAIEPVAGQLSDHYDPGHKVLRLSEGVYGNRSLAAMGIAAHEAGHAIQDASHFPGLVVRNAIVPIAGLGSTVFWILILAGLFLGMFRLIIAGIIIFSLTVVFQVINLPVEFDASHRARQMLLSTGLISPDEDYEVGRVLNAAAWTYVAATLTSVMTLLYYLFQFGLLGGHRSDE